jgi:hypothetical protein
MTTARKNQAKVDHRVYRTWLEVLFRAALIDNTEWQHRMRIKPGQDIIEQFAKYVERIVPVIAIESSLPYAEHLLIELIREHVNFNRPAFLPSLLSGHWQTSHYKPMATRTPLVLSFQESQGVENQPGAAGVPPAGGHHPETSRSFRTALRADLRGPVR